MFPKKCRAAKDLISKLVFARVLCRMPRSASKKFTPTSVQKAEHDLRWILKVRMFNALAALIGYVGDITQLRDIRLSHQSLHADFVRYLTPEQFEQFCSSHKRALDKNATKVARAEAMAELSSFGSIVWKKISSSKAQFTKYARSKGKEPSEYLIITTTVSTIIIMTGRVVALLYVLQWACIFAACLEYQLAR